MADHSRVHAALAAALLGDNHDGHLLGRFCRACVEVLPVDGAAISLMTDSGARETLCASDAVIVALDELQLTVGEGPCLEAFVTGGPVLIADLNLESASRWPVFAAGTVGLRIGGLFAFPVQIGAIRVGVMELYRRSPGALSSEQLAEALVVADAAALALLDVRGGTAVENLRSGWLDGEGLDKAQVYQATGMIMVQLGVGAEAAFARLRGHAFATGRMVSEVASDVVARRLRLDGDVSAGDGQESEGDS